MTLGWPHSTPILNRIRDRELPFWADPGQQKPRVRSQTAALHMDAKQQ